MAGGLTQSLNLSGYKSKWDYWWELAKKHTTDGNLKQANVLLNEVNYYIQFSLIFGLLISAQCHKTERTHVKALKHNILIIKLHNLTPPLNLQHKHN